MIAGCPPELLAYGFLLRGRVAARLQDFEEALACLNSGLKLAMGKEYDDIWIPFLSARGAVKEHLGDRSGALRDYEDAVKRIASFRDLLAEKSSNLCPLVGTGCARSALHPERGPGGGRGHETRLALGRVCQVAGASRTIGAIDGAPLTLS